MNLDIVVSNLEKSKWECTRPGIYQDVDLDMVAKKRNGLLDFHLLVKQFDVFDAKALLVWQNKFALMSQKSSPNWGRGGKTFLLFLAAKEMSADSLLLIKRSNSDFVGFSRNTYFHWVIVNDEENNMYWGKFDPFYKDATKILFNA